MSARETIRHVLLVHYADSPNPTLAANTLMANLRAEHRAEVLREAADKVALELAPEQPGAGPGFLLALRLAVRAVRRMADVTEGGDR